MSEKPTGKEGRIKVDKLKVNKETIEDLSPSEAKKVQGGVGTLGCTQPQDACDNLTLTCDTQGGADQCLGISKKRGLCQFG